MTGIRKAIEVSIARRLARTHCLRGHPLSGNNLRMRPNGGRECLACKRLRKRKAKDAGALTPALARRIFAAIEEGATRVKIHSTLVSSTTLKNFLDNNPKIARRIVPKLEQNRLASYTRRPQNSKVIIASVMVRNGGVDAFEAIMAATRNIPDYMRGEIQSDIWLDVSEERLPVRDIAARLQDYIKRYNRKERYSVASPWGNRSLAIGGGNLTLLDAMEDHGEWSPVAISVGRRVSNGRADI